MIEGIDYSNGKITITQEELWDELCEIASNNKITVEKLINQFIREGLNNA